MYKVIYFTDSSHRTYTQQLTDFTDAIGNMLQNKFGTDCYISLNPFSKENCCASHLNILVDLDSGKCKHGTILVNETVDSEWRNNAIEIERFILSEFRKFIQ